MKRKSNPVRVFLTFLLTPAAALKDEDVPLPSSDALRRTFKAVRWAVEYGLTVTSIEMDVLGGVAIYLEGGPRRRNRQLWISIHNNGEDTLVASEGLTVVWHAMLSCRSMAHALSWLSPDAVQESALE